jgi:hypothetical protein
MVILHAFLALLAGFATMALTVVIVTALLARLAPDWVGEEGKPRPTYAFVNLGYSFLAAAGGGYVTAWASAANPQIHVLVLGIVVLAMGALSALQSRGKQPVWYALTLLALMPLGVLAGGLLRLRVVGIL